MPDSDPLNQGDQDALNALLMSETPPDALAVLPSEERVATQGQNLRARVLDARTLVCTYRGHATKLLHAGNRKPWQREQWRKVRRGAYVRLLPRLLNGPDLALSVSRTALPVWLRPGLLGQVSLLGLDLLGTIQSWLHRCTRPIRRRLQRWPIVAVGGTE